MEEKTRKIRIFLLYKNQYFVAFVDRQIWVRENVSNYFVLKQWQLSNFLVAKKFFFFWYLLLERIRYPKCTEIRFLEISQKIEFKASLFRFVIFFGKFLSYLNNVFHSGVKIWQTEEKPCSIYLLTGIIRVP